MNGNTVTLANPIGNGGSGALAITNTAGGGSLTFQGANTYTGGTIINGGTLLANNTSGSGTGPGNVTVASGAIFGGTGTVAGNVTWQDGSYGNLTPTAHLTVSGTVTLNGSGSGNTININATGLTSSGSPYTLLTASSITGNVNPTPGGTGVFASGYIGVVSKSGNILILTVTASGVSSTWTDAHHGTSDNWSDTLNWTTGVPSNAGDSATFGSGGTGNPVNLNVSETVGGIVFTNASSYTITGANTLTLDNNNSGASIAVNNGSANVINTSVSLSDNTLITAASGASLTLGGAVANTSGSKALTVKGSGTVILSHANTYGPSAGSVGTTLDSSSGTPTLQLADDAALGAGDVSASSSTIKAAAANLSVANNVGIAFGATVTANNNGNAFALSGVISGLGALSATGGGSLTLTANNTYSGGTTNTTGQLNINNGGSSSANSAIGTGPLIINGGTIDNTSAGDVTLLPAIAQNWNGDFAYAGSAHNLNLGSGTVTLSANRQVTVSANTLTIGGIISGSGFGLTKAGAGTLALNAANTFSGTTAISGGTLTLGASAALQNSMLDYSSGTLTFSGITAASLGGLTGTQPGQNLVLNNDASAAVTLTVGGGGASTNYYGNLSGTGSLTKTGAGILTLTNANYTGVTTIGAGNLAIYGGSFGSASSTFIVGAAGGVVSNATLNALSGFIGTSASQSGAHLTVNGNATATFATGVTIGSAANTAGNLTVNTTGNVGLGAVTINRDSGSAAANAAGGLIVNQGTVTATTVTIAQSGVGGRGADLNINGGSLTIGDSSSTGAFSINSTTGNGYVTMSGGSLTYLGTDGLLMTIGGGPSVLNIYGGTATLTGVTLNSTNGSAITSTMTMLGTNSTPPTLYLGSVGLVANQPGATVSVTLSNAVVGAMADWSSAAPITLSGNTTLKAADAAAVAHNITLSGVLSGNGGLTKTGNGTLVLSGANTYTNSTTVSAGILELDQPSLFTNSSVSVASGASLNLNFIGTNQVSALVTNGVSKAPGLYDNGTDPTFITGTGKILVVPVVTINPNPPIMGVSINGNVLSLSWPTNAGWTLQAQTNSLSTGLGTNWTDVLGSTSITATNLTMDPTKPTVFYRLKL
jgi:autotransporter-associated beta strand protein